MDSSSNVDFLTDALGTTLALADASGVSIPATPMSRLGTSLRTAPRRHIRPIHRSRERWNGYYIYGSRYYSPIFQRFIGQDPSGLRGGDPNPYAYTRNDPLDFVDPAGLLGIGVVVGAAGEGGTGNSGGSAGTSELGGGLLQRWIELKPGRLRHAQEEFSGPPGNQIALPPAENNGAVGGSESVARRRIRHKC